MADKPDWYILLTNSALLPYAIVNKKTDKAFNFYTSKESAEKKLKELQESDDLFYDHIRPA